MTSHNQALGTIAGVCIWTLVTVGSAHALVGDRSLTLIDAQCVVTRTGEHIPILKCMKLMQTQTCSPGGSFIWGINGELHAKPCSESLPEHPSESN